MLTHRGFAYGHKMAPLPLDRRRWRAHGSTLTRDVQPGERVTSVSGVNSRAQALGNSAYPLQAVALNMSSGRVIRFDGSRREWDGSRFQATVPAGQVLRALSVRNGSFERLELSVEGSAERVRSNWFVRQLSYLASVAASIVAVCAAVGGCAWVATKMLIAWCES